MFEVRGELPLLRHVVAGLAVMALVAGCGKRPESAPAETATPGPAPAAVATAPAVKALSPLQRPELLAAAAAAANAAAAGQAPPRSNLDLTDRTFEIRLPFACNDGVLGAWGTWSVEPATSALHVSFHRQRWGDDPVFRALALGTAFDAAEGFWIERPWTSAEQCPAALPPPAAAPGQPATAPSPVHVLALVQYFAPDGPRTLRRGNRPYAYAAKLADGGQPEVAGFRVKLVGRISGFADGQPVHCLVQQASQPPVCAMAVAFTKVVLENAATGESLTEWGG